MISSSIPKKAAGGQKRALARNRFEALSAESHIDELLGRWVKWVDGHPERVHNY